MPAFLTSRLAVPLIAGVALVGVMLATHRCAYDAGRDAERAAALRRSIDLLRDRNLTDDQINAMDDSALCAALDGRWLPDERRCE